MSMQSDMVALGQAAKAARDHAESVLGQRLQYRLEWSARLTKSAGIAIMPANGRRAVVRLSAPIFRQAVSDLGITAACDEVRNTALHEIAHLVADEEPAHGPWWRETMLLLGADPDPYHHLTCGAALGGATARAARRMYPIGQWVEFIVKDKSFVGVVKGHNPKTISITVESELVGGFWEDCTRRRWWRIPWRLVGGSIIGKITD